MDERYIAAAVPFFFLLIGLELWVNRRRGDAKYRFHDSIANLSCGVGQQISNLGFTAAFIGVYAIVYEHFAVMHWSLRSAPGWVLLLFGVDLCYYGSHRASHRVNIFWAGHAVHHQSEEYNLSTALRQSWLEALLGTPFYMPLALLGFPPEMFLTTLTVNTLYQFWIHTRAVGKLGLFDRLFNSPSNHRVHHGIDPKYIDKNYGGMFTIWDMALGTYQAEEEEPVYGTVKPLASHNPLWANLAEWARIAGMASATRRFRDKVWVWFAPPEWRPADLGGPVTVPEVDRAHYKKYDVEAARGIDGYVFAHFAVILAMTTGLLWYHTTSPVELVAPTGAWVLASIIAWSGLFEGRRWGMPLEGARLLAAVGLAAWILRGSALFAPIVAGVGIAALGSLVFLVRALNAGAPRAPSTNY